MTTEQVDFIHDPRRSQLALQMDELNDSNIGEVAITRMMLRPGGWIGYTEACLYINRDDEKVKIRNDDVAQIALRTIEWDHVVMSLLLVGIGGYIGITRNSLVGVGFALVGVWSLYRSYEKRHKLVIHVQNRPNPVTVYPEYPTNCHKTLVDQTDLNSVPHKASSASYF